MQLNTRKIYNRIKKWEKDLNRHFSKKTYRRLRNIEKMLNIALYQGNANQNHNEYHLTPVSMAAIQKSTNNKCWRGCGEKGSLLHCWWECKLVQPLQRTMWRFLKNWKQNCHTTQRSHCWVYTPRKPELKRVPQCSSQHCF